MGSRFRSEKKISLFWFLIFSKNFGGSKSRLKKSDQGLFESRLRPPKIAAVVVVVAVGAAVVAVAATGTAVIAALATARYCFAVVATGVAVVAAVV